VILFLTIAFLDDGGTTQYHNQRGTDRYPIRPG
jgi:hypothetical protein